MIKAFKKILMILVLLLISINLSGCNIIELLDNAIDILNEFNGINDDDNSNNEYPNIDIDEVKVLSDLYSGVMPSVGNIKVLVVLIEFPDYTHQSKFTIDHMTEMFFGDGTTNESLASYYKKSSNSKLNITGDVLGWYKTESSSGTYERKYGDHSSDMILKEALNYYYSNNLIDVNNYDSDNDGYIDAVYGIYSKPENDFSDIWWAYQTYFEDYNTDDNYLQLGEKKFMNYIWASAHFLDSNGFFSRPTDISTYVHETGHLFGLDDYYDYDEYDGANVGLGGADMMDYNVGDHCSISKMLLGWIDPIVVNISQTNIYTISSFTETGDVLLIPLNEYNGIFGEYLLVEYYTPTGLNSTNKYLTKSGVRILYVNATLGDGGINGEYYTLFDHDNTDTDIPFVCMVSPRGFVDNDQDATNNHLFYLNDTFNATSIIYSDIAYKNFSLTIIGENSTDKNVTINVSFN